MSGQEGDLVAESSQAVPSVLPPADGEDLDGARPAVRGHGAPYLTVPARAERFLPDYHPIAILLACEDPCHGHQSRAPR